MSALHRGTREGPRLRATSKVPGVGQTQWRVAIALLAIVSVLALAGSGYYALAETRAASRHRSYEERYNAEAGSLWSTRSQLRAEIDALRDAQAESERLERERAAASEDLSQLRAEMEHLRGELESLRTSR